ncbi:ester cyclase [Confluentibacter sediminis]|uniref:ester cyclase n=1 Tax=Confluentibacter sediminis TaxID=2219045 RepID=UPI0013A68B06|nr:ester cyclase [Confluentibacter sediminis]
MEALKNKEIVKEMYEIVLNQKQIDNVNLFLDDDYIEEFNNTNKLLFTAFPDITFTIKEIFGDGNKVVTIYDWSGTHQKKYNNITPTNKKITVEGISIYELKNGKIIDNKAHPNKLSFLQQLGLVPKDFNNIKSNLEEEIYFIDEFEIPKKSFVAFKEKLDYNRAFIKNIEGFIEDNVIAKKNNSTTIYLTTIAVWQNQESLDNAKKMVQAEYKRIGFNPSEFNKILNIKMTRGIYSRIK